MLMLEEYIIGRQMSSVFSTLHLRLQRRLLPPLEIEPGMVLRGNIGTLPVLLSFFLFLSWTGGIFDMIGGWDG